MGLRCAEEGMWSWESGFFYCFERSVHIGSKEFR